MILAVDTGGTKTLLALFDDNGAIIHESKLPTPHDPDTYLAMIVQEVGAVITAAQGVLPRALVLATPGTHKDGAVVWGGGNLPWENLQIIAPLQQAYPGIPLIMLENDAHLGALGEVRRLDHVPDLALYVTISTGIGTGLVQNGMLDPALNRSEGGHAVLEFEGKLQEWEKFASGGAIHRHYGKYAYEIDDEATWREIADRMSRGFLAQLPLLQPDVVVIGGSIGTHFKKYQHQLLSILRERMQAPIRIPAFHEAKDAERAVVYGAYFYAQDVSSR